jgi:hypothetical protein
MKTRKFLALVVTSLLWPSFSLAQQPTVHWYAFDNDFISANYAADSAIAELSAKRFNAAKTVHSIKCGGNDGELHIGISLSDVRLSASQMPLTSSPDGDNQDWGLVAELPNAGDGDGPKQLKKLNGKAVTFQGYFRVWDEGHAVGVVHPSNPHHVFEVHPAWGFNGAGATFIDAGLIDSMDGYSGFGATKFKPLFKRLNDGEWPLAYQAGGSLHVGLIKDQNFYQLPVRVRKIKAVNGGHEVTVDVYSDKAQTRLVYSGLHCITVTDSPVDDALKPNQKAFLLGFFSVNLKKALDASAGIHSEANAVAVPEAVEFFVFGFPKKSAVTSCSKKETEE